MIPMVTGKIDLTVGYGIVLWHILAISLQTKLRLSLAARRAGRACARRRASDCSTACWSKSRRSTPSSRRSARARSSMRSRCGTRKGQQVVGVAAERLLCAQRRRSVRPADHRLLRPGARRRALDRRSNICRSAAISTRSAPIRRPPRSTAFRCALHDPAPSSPRAC